MQTCDEDDQAAMESVLSTFGASGKTAAAPGDDEVEEERPPRPLSPPVDARVHGPGRRRVDERRPLREGCPEPVMRPAAKTTRRRWSRPVGNHRRRGRSGGRSSPAGHARLDGFRRRHATGSTGEGGFEPAMQTCDEDDEAMESVLFSFNGQKRD